MNPLPRILRKTIVRRSSLLASVAIGRVIIVAIPGSAQQTANWVGSIRCEIQAQAPGYSHQETQVWTLTGATPTIQGSVTAYPATWSVTGQGSHDRTRYTNRRVAQWTVAVPGSNSPVTAPIGFTRHGIGGTFDVSKWHAQLTASGGYTGTDQFINDGVAQPAGRLATTVYEWQFPKIQAAVTDTQLTGVQSAEVRAIVGPLQPGEAQATVTCAWALGRRFTPPLPPPTIQPPVVVAGGAPAGGTATPPPTSGNPAAPNSPPSPPSTSAPGGSPAAPNAPAPSGPRLLSSAPTSVEQGTRWGTLALTGEGTHWQWQTSKVDLGPNTSVDHGNVSTPSPTSLTAAIYVDWDAAPGPRSVTVTTGNEVVTLPGAITIVPRERPIVTQISPTSARAGDTVIIRFTGKGTRWRELPAPGPGGRTVIHFYGGGITSPSTGFRMALPTVVSPTEMTAVIVIDSAAPPGPGDIWIAQASPLDIIDRIEIPNGFTVLPPLPPPGSGGSGPGGNSGPSIISFSPSSIEQGAYHVGLQMTGAATNWQRQTSVVDLGPGISVPSGRTSGHPRNLVRYSSLTGMRLPGRAR